MDVKQLIRRLNDFDTNAVVTVGDTGGGWSNIESVIEDGSCVKILMSDNVVFSDDRAARQGESAHTDVQQLKREIRALVSEFCDLYDGDLSNEAVSLLLTKLRELSRD